MDDRHNLDGIEFSAWAKYNPPRDAAIDRLERGRQAARQQWIATQNAYDLLCARVTPEDMDILYHVSRHAYRRAFVSGGLAEFNYLANLNR